MITYLIWHESRDLFNQNKCCNKLGGWYFVVDDYYYGSYFDITEARKAFNRFVKNPDAVRQELGLEKVLTPPPEPATVPNVAPTQTKEQPK
jgi:hypothetical protein